MSIVFISGVKNQGTASIRPDESGRPNIYVDGSCNVLGRINLGKIRPVPILFFGANTKQPPIRLPEKPSLLFNEISDADSHSVALERAAAFCNQTPAPVINHPDAVLKTTRDGISRMLQGIDGVQMPRTIRCTPSSPAEVFSIIASEGLEYPVIQRIAGDHNAKSMVLINGPEDLDKLHLFPFGTCDFYLTEFVDCSNDQGIYFKHRIIMVDGQPIARHVNFNKVWMVNSSCLDFVAAHPEFGTLQSCYLDLKDKRLPLAWNKFIEIGKRVGLEYFGIDCLVKPDGDVLIFEANPSMNTLNSRPKELTGPYKILIARMEKLIQDYSGESIS